MAKWYVKEFSKLTGVSVQTLHYYDRINLLKPSVRKDNGYRLYSEVDLRRLQQIIALKFFSFDLDQIKAILSAPNIGISKLKGQIDALSKKAKLYSDASNTLKDIIECSVDEKSIPWENLIKTIEVYNMSKELEHEWVAEIFTDQELKEYAKFESELKSGHGYPSEAEFKKSWETIVTKVKENMTNSPSSEAGRQIGQELMEWCNSVYGKEYAHLRNKKWEKGFGEGKGLDEVGLTRDMVLWMDKAVDTYWRDRIITVLGSVGKVPDESVSKLWQEVLEEMYGNEIARKQEITSLVLAEDVISNKAKDFVRNFKF